VDLFDNIFKSMISCKQSQAKIRKRKKNLFDSRKKIVLQSHDTEEKNGAGLPDFS
jgi:hypothetical protein